MGMLLWLWVRIEVVATLDDELGYWSLETVLGNGLEMRKGIGFHGMDMQLGMELEVRSPL